MASKQVSSSLCLLPALYPSIKEMRPDSPREISRADGQGLSEHLPLLLLHLSPLGRRQAHFQPHLGVRKSQDKAEQRGPAALSPLPPPPRPLPPLAHGFTLDQVKLLLIRLQGMAAPLPRDLPKQSPRRGSASELQPAAELGHGGGVTGRVRGWHRARAQSFCL